jgi:hypothetical protein
MKVGDWWVSRGVLTSGDDPSGELAGAAEQFGDDYTPMVFMTGDGHRTPAFQWATRGCFTGFFDEAIDDNKVCCYVETFSDSVKADQVPVSFQRVHGNHKVFGWEPAVFRNIQGIIEWIVEWIPKIHDDQTPDVQEIHYISREMYLVHNNGYLRLQGDRAMQYRDIVRARKGFPSDQVLLKQFLQFIKDYQRAAIALRVDPAVHRVVGRTIQQRIDQYPDHVHLITCGDAHVKDLANPLYNFITPPPGVFGVADESKS